MSPPFSGSGAVWLIPAAYAYAQGTYATYSNDQRAYRAIVGLGSAQIGLFQGGIYVGHQGTETGSGTAGGFIFGGRITYYPTHRFTIAASADEIINNSSQTTTTPDRKSGRPIDCRINPDQRDDAHQCIRVES